MPPPRVRDWLEAVHKVHGPSGVPSLQEATRWLEFFEAETRRAQSMVPLLRSRNVAELSDIVAASQRALMMITPLAAPIQRWLSCAGVGAR